ncbi:protein of unknown function [Rhodoferax sp. OV413]|uniref:DUF4136 domain-containing protein n=1 Tax=Rhodoferax sp. OV413 TaxID=1855285 RepID=UPI00088B7749|nr:DUF4136 domain-containing protein [Rhodoferax sp. OV413]SDP25714.1 protein of unknown function [Rhodoferax sp. OV413]
MLIWRTLLLAAAVLLTGCANLWRVDSEVQSFASWSSPPGPLPFRFERLPSQQTEAQNALEQLALPALNQAGFVLDTARPAYSLLITTQAQETTYRDDPFMWGGGYYSPWIGGGIGAGRGWGMGFSAPLWRAPPRNFQRQLSLVLRELSTGQVVYETRAGFDSRSPIGTDVVPALVAAALQGFPHPPAGPRNVTIELPH